MLAGMFTLSDTVVISVIIALLPSRVYLNVLTGVESFSLSPVSSGSLSAGLEELAFRRSSSAVSASISFFRSASLNCWL